MNNADNILVDKVKQRLQVELHEHERIKFIRLQIDYPDDYQVSDNSKFQAFIENYRRYLSRHGLDPHYVWITENTDTNRLRHQLTLLTNADAVYAEFNIDKARELWRCTLGISPLNCDTLITHLEICPRCRLGITNGIIARDDNIAISSVLSWSRSLEGMLENTKYEGFRRYGCSLLPDSRKV